MITGQENIDFEDCKSYLRTELLTAFTKRKGGKGSKLYLAVIALGTYLKKHQETGIVAKEGNLKIHLKTTNILLSDGYYPPMITKGIVSGFHAFSALNHLRQISNFLTNQIQSK